MKVRPGSIRRAGLLLVLAAGPVRAESPDARVATLAKIALLTTDAVSVTAVRVDSVDGKVTLRGKVGSEGEKERAAAAVIRIDGVKSVQNLLQVVPDLRPTLKVTDDAIKHNLEDAFKADPALSGVKVASVHDGVALLRGRTRTLPDKLRAIEVAWAVQGIQRVASEIGVATR
jgi:osmotically-inducible protein OsmY